MRNIKLTIEYDGTNYAGWQTQRVKVKTVQLTVEKALKKILGKKVNLIAAGRTDSGVHAIGQGANFKTFAKIPLKNIKAALNSLLPKDIVVREIEETGIDFHSQYQAKAKLYRYCISNLPQRPALSRDYLCYSPYKLDIRLMRKEAKGLVGRHDLKSFCATGSRTKDTVRNIKRISIKKLPFYLSPFTFHPNNYHLIVIDIEANGFLYNMARNIAGTLVEIGRGKFLAGSMKKILKAKDRKAAGPTMPAKGLCLMKVKY